MAAMATTTGSTQTTAAHPVVAGSSTMAEPYRATKYSLIWPSLLPSAT